MRVAAAITAVFLSVAYGADVRLRLRPDGVPRRSLTPERVHTIVRAEQSPEFGGRVLSRMPDGRVLVSVRAADRSAAAIESSSKISGATTADAESQYLLVLFHPDVDRGDAVRILLDSGVSILQHPDLVPSEWLVIARREQIQTLAAWDEVAYIFPASDELVRGVPVLGCSGPLVDTGPMAQYVATYGPGWDGEGKGSVELTYSLSRLTDRLPRDEVVLLLRKALLEWQQHASVQFRQADDASASRNLTVVFSAGAHGDGYPFDGPGRVLAHTFYPAGVNPEPIAGDLHLDDEESWTDGGQPDLYSVLLHELGHALGLGHSDKPGAVMYPYYGTLTVLQPDDISAIQRLYAAPLEVVSTPAVRHCGTRVDDHHARNNQPFHIRGVDPHCGDVSR